MTEDALSTAERQVREGEARVARQEAIVAKMDRDDHPEAAAVAREVLATPRETLGLMRGHLEAERRARGL